MFKPTKTNSSVESSKYVANGSRSNLFKKKIALLPQTFVLNTSEFPELFDTNTNTNTNISKKNVTWTDQQLTNSTNENISLVIKEVPDKLDILINKVDILIDLITNLAKQSVAVNSLDPPCSEI